MGGKVDRVFSAIYHHLSCSSVNVIHILWYLHTHTRTHTHARTQTLHTISIRMYVHTRVCRYQDNKCTVASILLISDMVCVCVCVCVCVRAF